MTTPKTIKIKAIWSIYGPKFQHKGRRIEVSECNSWAIAIHDLDRWIEINAPGSEPVFTGDSGEFAKEEWDELQNYLAKFK